MSIKNTTSVYAEYRDLCIQKKIHPEKRADQKIVTSIIQLHLKIAEVACKNFTKRRFTNFDPTLGDHNCHLITHFVLESCNDKELHEEATALEDYILSKKGKYQSVSKIEEFDPQISKKLKTLVSLALLDVATTCFESPGNPMVLKLDPSKIQHQISKACPIEIIKLLLQQHRESLNSTFIERVQHLPTSPPSLLLVETAKSVHQVTFKYVCAMHSLKATLQDLYEKGVAFSIEHYSKTKEPVECAFVSAGLFPSLELRKVTELKPETPVMSVQVFCEEKDLFKVTPKLSPSGLLEFMLHSIAKLPQFTDLDAESCSLDLDLKHMAQEDQKEIQAYRKMDLYDDCEIVHTYPTTVEELCSRLRDL